MLETYVGKTVFLSGWKKTSTVSSDVVYMGQTQLRVISNTACQATFRHITYNHMCTDDKTWFSKTQSCSIESGTPLIYFNNEKLQLEQVAIVSRNEFTCADSAHMKYVKIGPYRLWIEAIINSEGGVKGENVELINLSSKANKATMNETDINTGSTVKRKEIGIRIKDTDPDRKTPVIGKKEIQNGLEPEKEVSLDRKSIDMEKKGACKDGLKGKRIDEGEINIDSDRETPILQNQGRQNGPKPEKKVKLDGQIIDMEEKGVDKDQGHANTEGTRTDEEKRNIDTDISLIERYDKEIVPTQESKAIHDSTPGLYSTQEYNLYIIIHKVRAFNKHAKKFLRKVWRLFSNIFKFRHLSQVSE